jgi:hypothetical protein
MNSDLREKVKKTIEESQEDGSKIIKELVVGFLIVKSKVSNGNSYVNVIPLNSSCDGFNDDHDLDPNEEIVGVIPAPQGSYKILGLFPCEDGQEYPNTGKYDTLGYEYQGAYYPDWKKLLEENIKSGEYLKKEKKTIIFSD